ncbi:hypothetical protein [Cloacibacillus sp. An23]|uniref:hypothetical protein n=1 Tax=Cloacibacillus sp. An23 TaxID=1965591 RepID=UPI000B386905|nr:hypothetical protein [Cloacibacillus sp. An23]OUO93938.1 hypothetical protein B5F39_04535 [Cloacibacillus sp. An23]
MRCVFFPLAHGGPLPDEMAALLDGASVWLTARGEDEISRLSETLPPGAEFAGGSVTAGAALSDVAPAAVACAEALGGIDALVFAPALSSKERLLLDISPVDFSAHVSALNVFFEACKCALPYMMGREAPVIAVRLPGEPANLTERMYRAAMESMLEDMASELGEWGVAVKKFYD